MQYHHRDGPNPSHPAGESKKPQLRVDFDRCPKPEFHGGKFMPGAGLPAYRELDEVLDLADLGGSAWSDLRRGTNAINWARLFCHGFRNNEVRLQRHVLAYNMGNFLRTLALPDEVEHWALTTWREKLVKIGAEVIRHGRCTTFQLADQLAEITIPRCLFAEIVRLIDGLRPKAAPT